MLPVSPAQEPWAFPMMFCAKNRIISSFIMLCHRTAVVETFDHINYRNCPPNLSYTIFILPGFEFLHQTTTKR